MKNLLIATLLSIPFFVSAQGSGEKNNEIETYKIAYITEKLGLSSEEAKIFWPVYNDWQKEQDALRKERFQKMISFRKINEIDELSDAQVQALITNDFEMKQKELNLDKKYYYKLKAILPIKIVGKYFRAQEAFKREILSRYRNGKQGRN
ncbi:MAG: hypothetical protein V4594_08990 [Bacteroidota bacterium]